MRNLVEVSNVGKHVAKSSIDTALAAEKYRARVINVERRQLLISRIAGSQQVGDLMIPPNCEGLGRVRHFKRATSPGWPSNPLPIDPACISLGIPFQEVLTAQVFQNAACAWRCWYCFVPYALLAGDEKRGAWSTAEELVDLYMKEVNRPSVVDLSGGSPDLTPEWVVWTMNALQERGLVNQVYLWSDDNLSTDYLWTMLSARELDVLRSYRSYGRVACFKGFDESSFAFNTHARPQAFGLQFDRFKRLLDLEIDLYAYVTLTSPDIASISAGVPAFLDRLQEIHENLPLRTIPLRISTFSPVTARMTAERTASLCGQEQAIKAWNHEIERRFSSDMRQRRVTEVRFDHVAR